MKLNNKIFGMSLFVLAIGLGACSSPNPLLKGELKENAQDLYVAANIAENEVHWHKGEKGNFYMECVESTNHTKACKDLVNIMQDSLNNKMTSSHTGKKVSRENLFDKNMWDSLKEYYKAAQYMDSQD